MGGGANKGRASNVPDNGIPTMSELWPALAKLSNTPI